MDFKKAYLVLFGCLMVVAGINVEAATYRITESTTVAEFRSVVDNLQPGDNVVIASGTYLNTDRWRFIDVKGTAAAPIRIGGEEPDRPPTFMGGADFWVMRNTYVTYHDFS